MVAILTGDIVNSRKVSSSIWLDELKHTLNHLGTSQSDWEIYRGDSFQLRIDPKNALSAAFLIKSCIKTTAALDARMAIGLGTEDFIGENVLQSNGEAYIFSGEAFDALKTQKMLFRSVNFRFNQVINLMIQSLSLTTDNWPPVYASIIHAKLMHPEKTQIQLSQLLGKNQSTISEALKKTGYQEISNVIQYYQQEIQQL